MADLGRSWPIWRPRAVERELNTWDRSGARCELTWGKNHDEERPARAHDDERRTAALQRRSAKVRHPLEAKERERNDSATSQERGEGRQVAHGGQDATQRRIAFGVDRGGENRRKLHGGWCSG